MRILSSNLEVVLSLSPVLPHNLATMSTAMDQSTAAARNRKPLQTTTEPTATSTASQVQEKRIREASKSSLIPGRRKKRSTSSDDEEGEELPKKVSRII